MCQKWTYDFALKQSNDTENFKILSRHCYYKERSDKVVYIYSSIIMPRNWTVFRNDDESLMSFLGLEKTKDTLNIY